ncbi:2-oxo-4-hydroxy-4-carboxy-5-ureidoimidazoline decarboxylase [Hydrogenophaga sp.]|uniref:2-oxo-4-hydroxy-4-carboxy-5-ureidoimidazoline decarboxylase n=1 Tax=Hydrogenophaga sp. TaxID=1904254 RepID=UPI003919CEDF
MTLTLDQLNSAPTDVALAWLDGLYEHSPWIAEAALAQRPFASLAALKWALVQVLEAATLEQQLALVRAHPELAGKAMVAKSLTAESTDEQTRAGLTHCTPEEFERLQQLNRDYNARFGFPFILAVRGPRGTGLNKQEIIATLERRLHHPVDVERAEALRNIHRIAEIRLADKFGEPPEWGDRVWDWHEDLARHSEPGYLERGQLTVTYLTDAHRACAAELVQRMKASGFDEVGIDAVGNVVGRYHPAEPADGFAAGPPQGETHPLGGLRTAAPALPAQGWTGRRGIDSGDAAPCKGRPAQRRSEGAYLLTGSHYDTVRNGGKYDGRLGIFVPIACVQQLHEAGRRLPFGIEVVAFAEEEGQRYKATFLGSSALTGHFDPAWLDQRDAQGVSMREAMRAADLPGELSAIQALRRDPAQYLGFVEVHIEQGPVLNALNLPLGVVTSINASVRYLGEVVGMASHAGTTPMNQRRDAAAALAEFMLALERRARLDGDSVATVGQLEVPNGSINVVPGRCRFSLDLRAPSDAQRDALARDALAELQAICERRGVRHTLEETMRASAAPSHPAWQARWERAVQALGLPVHRLPSGAGHDAMKLHEVMPQAMLFVRGLNGGISHNPLESSTGHDIDLSVRAFAHLLDQLAHEHKA